MNRSRQVAGLLVVLGGLLLIFSRLPLGTAFEFGQDERYELMKGFLCSKGFVLHKEIWNDQPPVHTMLLSAAFKAWGPSILTARMVAAGFGLLLFSSFYLLVRQRSSMLCALLAAFLLLASPVVLLLSASVMLEVPAIGTALLSALLLRRWGERPQWGWLVASGAVMGVALQIKLTAAVVVPAMLVELALHGGPERGPAYWRETLLSVGQWGAAAIALFLGIGFTWGSGSLQSSFRSHFGHQVASLPGVGGPADFPFAASLLWQHLECVLAALAGLLWAVRQPGRWREIRFPATMLATVSLIHVIHRPWWNYYYLHFAVPVAWLAGWATTEALGAAAGLLSVRPLRASSRRVWQGIAVCALAAVVLARSERRLEGSIDSMRRSPRANADAMLAAMRRYAGQTHWVCAQSVIYPFHARLPVPPELAVVMAKRFWSGQMTAAEIVGICRRYKPEQILLPNAPLGSEWKEFLASGYGVAQSDKDFVLYVDKALIR
ncbi:membrane hypothetical protein [Verrucomicrobia bacterium]|nr:membrane hypothetical protein [Verrucomicrobiota bacterium]